MPIATPLTDEQARLLNAQNAVNRQVLLGSRVQTIEVDVGNVADLTTSAHVIVDAINEVASAVPVGLSSAPPVNVSTVAASAGVGTAASRNDHVHLLPTVTVSAGSIDAGKIPALDVNGVLDSTFMDYTSTTPANVSTTAGAAGTAGHPARIDHVHRIVLVTTSAGAGDSGKPIGLNGVGRISGTMLATPAVKAAAADRITNTSTLTTFATTGSIPANLPQGTHIRVSADIKQVATQGSNTVALSIYADGVVICTFAAATVSAGVWVRMIADVYVQTAGVGGSITSLGETEVQSSTPTFHGSTADSVAFDWSVANPISVKCQQQTASTGNQTDLRMLEVQIVGSP